ncbi:MAG: sulfate reduction electron transfer complex DsrMKJOP subunit DsrJ [Thermodesulfobacteriota bacterium]
MYNTGKVLTGLVLFVGFITYPFWGGEASPVPKLQKPEKEKQCIEPVAFMRAQHMQMLDDWRNDVVRQATRKYTAVDGKQHNMSLQNTCMKCHTSKKEFCDKCHTYAGVSPFCWTCHVPPKETT